jgi:hypothetical protein
MIIKYQRVLYKNGKKFRWTISLNALFFSRWSNVSLNCPLNSLTNTTSVCTTAVEQSWGLGGR